MIRQVIINADDFGLSPGVNRGIVEAYRAGGITSTSMMVNMPGFTDAVGAASSLTGLGIGLHFNLTYGRPLSDPATVPSLVKPDGMFHDGGSKRIRNPSDVAAELSAQWQKLADTSIVPTHLDSHQLLHQDDPVIYQVMAGMALRQHVPLRRSQIVHPLPHHLCLKMTDHILLDSYGDSDGLFRLLQYLRELPPGITEIICHPGYVDGILRGVSGWTDIRERELLVFTNPEIFRSLRELSIHPANFNAVKGELAPSDMIRTPMEKKPGSSRMRPPRKRRPSVTRARGGIIPKRRRSRYRSWSGKRPPY